MIWTLLLVSGPDYLWRENPDHAIYIVSLGYLLLALGLTYLIWYLLLRNQPESLIQPELIKQHKSLAKPVFDSNEAVTHANGNQSLAKEMLSLFKMTLQEDFESIKKHMTAGNRDGVRESIHRLTGAIQFTSAPRVEHYLSLLKESLLENNSELSGGYLLLLEDSCREFSNWTNKHTDPF